VAIAGPRGAGKSTTALRLAQAGHPLVTDDVSPLDTAGGVTVRPFERPVHVFPHTADTLGVDVSGAHPLTPDHVKLALPAATRGPVGVHAIAVLELSDAPGVETVRVEGAQALWHVQMNAYRIELLDALYRADVFAWSGAVARQVPVHTVRRPRTGWTVDDVAAAIAALA
jgi:hypothetical protein